MEFNIIISAILCLFDRIRNSSVCYFMSHCHFLCSISGKVVANATSLYPRILMIIIVRKLRNKTIMSSTHTLCPVVNTHTHTGMIGISLISSKARAQGLHKHKAFRRRAPVQHSPTDPHCTDSQNLYHHLTVHTITAELLSNDCYQPLLASIRTALTSGWGSGRALGDNGINTSRIQAHSKASSQTAWSVWMCRLGQEPAV